MIIKCPHCRYKYEDDVASGIQELSCVCPRCAYPFSVQVSTGEGREESKERRDEVGGENVDSRQTIPGQAYYRSDVPPAPNRQPFGVPTVPPVPPPVRPAAQPRRQNTGCCLKTLIIMIIVAAGIILLGRSCYNSFTADDLDPATTEYGSVSGSGRDDAYAQDANPRKLPKWVQGNWNYRDENGFEISVTIHGRNIAETSGGETSYGSITFDDDIITAHFNDGHQMHYKVYKDEKVIDAGSSNLKMKKTE